jgi:RNA 3'-terminal phosphate cyclase
MTIKDASEGAGSGQILRAFLAQSLVTDPPFPMERIRAKHQNKGSLSST